MQVLMAKVDSTERVDMVAIKTINMLQTPQLKEIIQIHIDNLPLKDRQLELYLQIRSTRIVNRELCNTFNLQIMANQGKEISYINNIVQRDIWKNSKHTNKLYLQLTGETVVQLLLISFQTQTKC